MLEDHKPFRIFILGAGFSRPAGYPLATELWAEIRRRAARLGGRASKFQHDLDAYGRFKHECDGLELTEDDIDFEEFCRYLDIEHFLGLRGSDTWSSDGNEGTVVIKTLLGQILAECTPSVVPQLYLQFAERLQPDDYVLTFNYDTLLERALDAIGKPYRLFPTRYRSVHGLHAEIDDSRDEVILLKLHGSIDWFDISAFAEWQAARAAAGLANRPDHPIFGPNGDDLAPTRLVDGPRYPDDPLSVLYRVTDVKRTYERRWMFQTSPWLLAPSTMKILYSGRLSEFWRGLGRAGTLNFGAAIIGYSLPDQDDYARQVVHAIVSNYQSTNWGHEVFGQVKTPLAIVDLRRGQEEITRFCERYRFVDWSRAVTYYGGFDANALAVIFDRAPAGC